MRDGIFGRDEMGCLEGWRLEVWDCCRGGMVAGEGCGLASGVGCLMPRIGTSNADVTRRCPSHSGGRYTHTVHLASPRRTRG